MLNRKRSEKELKAYYHEDVKLPQEYYDRVKEIISDPKNLTKHVTLAVFELEHHPDMDLSE